MKSYDIEKAKDFFAAKVAFTTGLHEVQGMVERGDDVVIVGVRPVYSQLHAALASSALARASRGAERSSRMFTTPQE